MSETYSNSPMLMVEQVAERWRCSERTVRDMLLRGELKGFKLRNTWRIPMAAVVDYEEKPRVSSEDALMKQYAANAVVTRIGAAR